jgi:hypothetical protein
MKNGPRAKESARGDSFSVKGSITPASAHW